jgi:hypothetical protein
VQKEMQRRVYNEAGESELKTYYLWGSDEGGWRVIRRVRRLEAGRRQCERGAWREQFNEESGELIGWRLVSPEEMTGDQAIQTTAGSTAAIVAAEMETNAGLRGRSYTARLSEDERLERQAPEDFIERTTAKVRVWPDVHGAPGDILRAWPRT